MNGRFAILAAALAILWTPTARAQMVDPTHPCYEAVSFYLDLSVTDAIWGNADALAELAARIRQDLFDTLGKLDKLDAEIATAAPAKRAEMLAELKKLDDCIPWLDAALSSLESRLRVLGVNAYTVDVAGARKRVQHEEFFKEVRAGSAAIRSAVNAILVRRRGRH